ncbi:MAG TPA: hypothetical protein DCF68_20815 [Cyanothece sp. UBA12306]|nr:hypothetical protein [Cyanothece sp. UBA12306]
MTRYILFILLLILSFFIASPTQASFCREIDGHSICIEKIKRSAKNYWEYRTSLKVDGRIRPTEVYNCRDHIIIQKDKTVVSFKDNRIGYLICRILDK